MTMSTTGVDREMFRRVYGRITAEPLLHDQFSWEERTACSTTRCVAGWAVWEKAKELGLVSDVSDPLDVSVLCGVASRTGLHLDEGIPWDDLFQPVGGHLLGLDEREADSLFHDLNDARAVARVKSYADTGCDLTADEFFEFD